VLLLVADTYFNVDLRERFDPCDEGVAKERKNHGTFFSFVFGEKEGESTTRASYAEQHQLKVEFFPVHYILVLVFRDGAMERNMNERTRYAHTYIYIC